MICVDQSNAPKKKTSSFCCFCVLRFSNNNVQSKKRPGKSHSRDHILTASAHCFTTCLLVVYLARYAYGCVRLAALGLPGGPVLVKRCKSFFLDFEIKPFPSKVRALFPILKILSSTDEWFRRYKLYVDLYNSKFVTLIHKKDVCHTYTYFTN